MLCDTALHRPVFSFVYSEKRLVPMYTKHREAEHFISVVSIILRGKSVDRFVHRTKTVPRV